MSHLNEYYRMLELTVFMETALQDQPANNVVCLHYQKLESVYSQAMQCKNIAMLGMTADCYKGKAGVALKTFGAPGGTLNKTEKIAEFDANHQEITRDRDPLLIVQAVSAMRNKRIADTLEKYKLTSIAYHVVARRENQVEIHEYPLEPVDMNKLSLIRVDDRGSIIRFSDGKTEYGYLVNKSALTQKFNLKEPKKVIPINRISSKHLLEIVGAGLNILERFTQIAKIPKK